MKTDWLPSSVLIIAELSANHHQNLDTALATLGAMAEAGADAVKVQTYRPESMCLNVDNGYFGKRQSGPWKGRTLWDLYTEAALPYEWHRPIQREAERLGLRFFSSPFDLAAVDFLQRLDVPYFKIASFEINHIPLLKKVAATQKPVIISTGVATEEDIELALATCREAGNSNVLLLKCTSQYPATIADANLMTLPDMRQRFCVPVGLSDHTAGAIVPVTAVSLGARAVEKHVILDRSQGGPDAHFSMEPEEFADMVRQVRQVEQALGNCSYAVSDSDKARRRSIFVVSDLNAGQIITEADVAVLRNGAGLHSKHWFDVIGNAVLAPVKRGNPLLAEHMGWGSD